MLPRGVLVSAAKFAGFLSWSLKRRQEGVYFEKQSLKLGIGFLIEAPALREVAEKACLFLLENTRNL